MDIAVIGDITLAAFVQVLCMSREEFSEFKDNEGWEEAEEEEDARISLAFSNKGLPGLNAQWKRLIHTAAHVTLTSYGVGQEEGEDVDRDQALMKDKAAAAGLNRRQLNAVQVRYGQKDILYKIMELTKT